jgi:hypothetical protein
VPPHPCNPDALSLAHLALVVADRPDNMRVGRPAPV